MKHNARQARSVRQVRLAPPSPEPIYLRSRCEPLSPSPSRRRSRSRRPRSRRACSRRRFSEAGAIYEAHGWVGSRSKSWVVSGRLEELIQGFAPQVVLVTLETNVLGQKRTDVHAAWVRRLVERIGKRRCYWLGPTPLVDDPFHYDEILPGACTPCRYFDTSKLPYPKREDGRFHLTRGQGLDWAERVWAWMNDRAEGEHAL